MHLTTELLDVAGELAAKVPGVGSDVAATAADQVERLGSVLDTPAGQQQLIDLLERTAQDVLAAMQHVAH